MSVITTNLLNQNLRYKFSPFLLRDFKKEQHIYYFYAETSFISFCAFAALFSGSGKTVIAQGWTFTESVQQTGSCIPYVPFPFIVYATREACEYNRQAEINNTDGWDTWEGTCTTIVTCTPCVGSDIGWSRYVRIRQLHLRRSGEVSITGLLTGNALFSPHDIKDIENWVKRLHAEDEINGHDG